MYIFYLPIQNLEDMLQVEAKFAREEMFPEERKATQKRLSGD